MCRHCRVTFNVPVSIQDWGSNLTAINIFLTLTWRTLYIYEAHKCTVKAVWSYQGCRTNNAKLGQFWWHNLYKSCLFYLWPATTCLERPPWRAVAPDRLHCIETGPRSSFIPLPLSAVRPHNKTCPDLVHHPSTWQPCPSGSYRRRVLQIKRQG